MVSAAAKGAAFLQRHELDLLAPTPFIEASPVKAYELQSLVAIAQGLIPTLAAGETVVREVWARNHDSVFAFRHHGRLLGGIAHLFLNDRGFDALLLDEIDFSRPDVGMLAERGEAPAAIYVWACFGRGRAMAGLAGSSARLRLPPYASADYYAQPHTADGARFLQQMSFEQTPSMQPDLWVYRRRVNGTLVDASQAHSASLQRAA